MASSRLILVYPLSQMYLGLAYMGVGPLLGASSQEMGARETAFSQSVFAVFTALLVQACGIHALTQLGPKRSLQHILHPPTAIYAVAWSYYAYKIFGTPPLIAHDVFGLAFEPLHLFLWMCSTSCQCILCEQIYFNDCVGVGKGFPLPAKALVLTLTMLWTGLLGWLDWRPYAGRWGTALSTTLNLASCVSFYLLLSVGTRPLRNCAVFFRRVHEQRLGDPSSSQSGIEAPQILGRHFTMARAYLCVTWHAFPLGWLLAAFGYIDGETRELMFISGDLMAKFLPISMYLSLLTVPQ